MNSALKILLQGEGFRQVKTSCEFTRIYEQSERKAYWFRVWLHRDGGQAEVCEADTGRKIARMELWRSMEDLQEFFKEFH